MAGGAAVVMIEYLRISGLGVIAEADLALSRGLVAVTGETGAGKTMITSALDLLFGGRANPGLIRPGADRATVEAGIRPPDPSTLPNAEDFELEEGLLLIGRSLGEQRSRAWLAGRGVPASLLAELGDDLVVRHGQNDQRRLASGRYRRALLDRYAGEEHLAAVATFAERVEQLRALEAELLALRSQDRAAAQRADLLRHGLAEIEAAQPLPGEEDELRNELRRLEHAVDLRESLGQAYHLLREQEDHSAEATIAAAERLVGRGALHDESLAPLAEELGQAGTLIADAAAAIGAHIDGLAVDPHRLDEVQQRLGLLKSLQRKYGDSIEEVLRWADEAAAQLAALDTSEERLAALSSQRSAVLDAVVAQGVALSRARRDAAARLTAAVTGELAALALPHASLSVEVATAEDRDGVALPDGRRARLRQDGFDDIDLVFVAHPGSPPTPIESGASGGELSRVMLALEVALAGANPVPVFVFDEVDAGIGGHAAVEVGRRLARLAAGAQVIVVTHLPQVAAFADQHIAVRKTSDGRVTASGIESLEPGDRARELARMMTGLADSATALAHAEELIDLASREQAGAQHT
jgi:DNA repair protein RecN (Recombination protein N)